MRLPLHLIIYIGGAVCLFPVISGHGHFRSFSFIYRIHVPQNVPQNVPQDVPQDVPQNVPQLSPKVSPNNTI